jgi:hypothetical protein
VVQVWFLPNIGANATANIAAPVQIVHGTVKMDAATLTWTVTENANLLKAMFVFGGQVLIRVHCGHLFDTEKRPVSASLDAVSPFPNAAPMYGGIFESWFFAIAG